MGSTTSSTAEEPARRQSNEDGPRSEYVAPADGARPPVVGLIVARSDSSRLPGKALRQVAGLPLIGYVIERAKRIAGLSGLALATTDRAVDDELAAYACACGVDVCRGATDDVVKRLLDCSGGLDAHYLLRLNGDAPFLDPELVQEGLNRVPDGFDLISNVVGRTFPYGVSVELVSRRTLVSAHPNMTQEDREHVTRHFYLHRDRYNIYSLTSAHPELSGARMVVDTEDDLRVLERVVRRLGESALTTDYLGAARCYLDIGWTQNMSVGGA